MGVHGVNGASARAEVASYPDVFVEENVLTEMRITNVGDVCNGHALRGRWPVRAQSPVVSAIVSGLD